MKDNDNGNDKGDDKYHEHDMITSRYSLLNHLLLLLVASFIRSKPAGGRMVVMAQSFKHRNVEIRGYGDDCVNAGDFRRAPDLPSWSPPDLLLT